MYKILIIIYKILLDNYLVAKDLIEDKEFLVDVTDEVYEDLYLVVLYFPKILRLLERSIQWLKS